MPIDKTPHSQPVFLEVSRYTFSSTTNFALASMGFSTAGFQKLDLKNNLKY